MPDIRVAGCRLHYDIDGPTDAPALMLLHSLGTTTELWSGQLERFCGSFRVVRCDLRGHGRSDAPPGPYALARLGHDVLAVLDAIPLARAHICGVSLGGLLAMWLALHAPHRVDRIVPANTAARLGTHDLWSERIRLATASGLHAVANTVIKRWFTASFRQDHPATVNRFREMFATCSLDGYAGACAALRDADLLDDIHRIEAPTLVVTGCHDAATPSAVGQLIVERVPRARRLELDAAHLSNVEQAAAFTSGVHDFLSTSG